MKVYAPDYYYKFKCIADKCKHNCCIGWEIDIDNDTYETYKNTKGYLGKKLKENILTTNEDEHCFKLTENERCPFLLENNLCEIILNSGEDSLCQICTDHPRFRNYLESRTEIGLGLCCEAAADLILNNEEITNITVLSDDGNIETETSEEINFLSSRKSVLEIIQDRSISLEKRIDKICKKEKIEIENLDIISLTKALLSLEQLDNNWTQFLNSIPQITIKSERISDIKAEQLLVYFIYRHMTLENTINGLKFAITCLKIILTLAPYHNDFNELCRMFSGEIEYCEENTEYFML